MSNSMDMSDVLIKLGIQAENLGTSTGQNFFSNGDLITSYSPVDGEEIAKVQTTTKEDYEKVVTTALEAYKTWRLMPAPKRGEIVRQFGNRLRDYKQELGMLVSYEMGKSLQEGLGEVQEMIDICDFATTVFPAEMTVDYIRVYQQNTVGVEEETTQEINCYPNPANNVFNVENPFLSPTFTCKIFALDGRLIYSESSQDRTTHIPCSDWTNGMYFVECTNPQGQSLKKLFLIQD